MPRAKSGFLWSIILFRMLMEHVLQWLQICSEQNTEKIQAARR